MTYYKSEENGATFLIKEKNRTNLIIQGPYVYLEDKHYCVAGAFYIDSCVAASPSEQTQIENCIAENKYVEKISIPLKECIQQLEGILNESSTTT